MQKYIVGFVFDSKMEYVLLMHKNRPEWQNGFINGLGGKVEKGETFLSATVREIKEESGLETEEDKWVHAGVIGSDSFSVEILGYVYEGQMSDAQSLEDEPIEWFPLNKLPPNVLDNLPWLIHITIDKIKNQKFETFDVRYKN
jgi:8-oxo-dGTP diphosphatase